MTTAAAIGPGGLDINAKPVFIATAPSRFVATEKESLTDQEKIALKNFQLHRRLFSMQRRDEVYKSVTTGDFTTSKAAQTMMGTPYPIIKAKPTLVDGIMSHRWYEYALELTLPGIYVNVGSFRAYFRLTGNSPNEPECLKYGVTESKARLEEKKRLWEQYAHYRMEWMRRWDYHVYGIRPGETFSFFSPCFFPPTPPRYNTRTDFPLRDEVTIRGKMTDVNYEPRMHNEIVFHPAQPDIQKRPELMHLRDMGSYPGMDKRFSKINIEERQ